MELLIDKGFDPKMGARPLSRIIDQSIKKPLSREMLFGKLRNGGGVLVDADSNNVILNYTEIEETVQEINDENIKDTETFLQNFSF
jgi:ATP-dependent Clp protease ATP-binding subunit ClpA